MLAQRSPRTDSRLVPHTPFPATPEFGLSTVDVRLHSSTFRRPWQIAALLNVTPELRVLRVYGPVPDAPTEGLGELPFWVAQPEAPVASETCS
jgi:hypothetical protein